MNICRKYTLQVVGDKEEKDRVYKYLRDGIYNQNLAMNQYMSALYMAEVEGLSKEDKKELNRLYNRISSSKKGSAYDDNIVFAKGLPIGAMGQKVRQDFNNACKKGLIHGRISLPTYTKNNPLLIHVDYVRLASTNPHNSFGLYHNYESHEEFLDHLYKSDLEIFIKFANNITFKINFGHSIKRSAEKRATMKKIFEEEYKVGGSSIGIKDGKIILNLTIDVPKQVFSLDENVVVGVDVGMAVPAMCALKDNDYISQACGNEDKMLAKRTELQNEYKRLQKRLKYNSGGHGRKKKLKPLEKLKSHERNFVQTYNHMISKEVVDFAIKNKAKYINLEDLSGFPDRIKKKDKDKPFDKRAKEQFVLRNWSYYELQSFITYKAQMAGIEVRKVNPAYTSQTCSCCRNIEPGQRLNQSTFVCKKCGKKMNADFNAARNIAMSTEFVKEKA